MIKIEHIYNEAELIKFTSLGMKLAYLVNSRLDLVFEISQIAQMTWTMIEQDSWKHCKRLEKAIKYVHDSRASICIPKLDLDTLHVFVYRGATFANNIDLSPQFPRIVLHTDMTNKTTPISYRSYKSRIALRSVLSAELIVFADLTANALIA